MNEIKYWQITMSDTNPGVRPFDDEEVLTASNEECSLVVYNDDFNTFDYVIQTLIEVCGHTPQQAEQCTLIIHFKGSCDVRWGSYEQLEPMCREILRRGITAKILS